MQATRDGIDDVEHALREPEAEYDVIVIGVGPAGLTAAIYTSSLKLRTLVFEGSNPSRLKWAHAVNNYPGFPEGIQGAELLRRLREQALKFGTEIRKGDVLAADLIGDIKTVTTHDASVTARTAIIATGIQQKRTEITGEDRFLGAGVSYCVICDGPLFRSRTAAVVGEGPEAVDDAKTLSHIASKTYLVSPTGAFQASEKQLREVEEHRVEILKGSRVKAIEGITSVEALRLTDQKGNEQILKVHGVFIASTKTPLTRILSKSGLQTDDKGCIKIDGRMRTNIEGVYAAGDCTCGGLQASISVGEGAKAALAALAHIRTAAKENLNSQPVT